MMVKSIQIECDMPECVTVFRAHFVTTAEMARYESAAKREGWRRIRIGNEMADVCPGHPEVI